MNIHVSTDTMLVVRWRVLSVLIRLLAAVAFVFGLIWLSGLDQGSRLYVLCGASAMGFLHLANGIGAYCWDRAREIREWHR